MIIFLSLVHKSFAGDRRVYQLTMAFTALAALYDALSAFSAMTGLFTLPKAVVTFFSETLPLGEYAMGWLPLAGIGFLLGYVRHLFAREK